MAGGFQNVVPPLGLSGNDSTGGFGTPIPVLLVRSTKTGAAPTTTGGWFSVIPTLNLGAIVAAAAAVQRTISRALTIIAQGNKFLLRRTRMVRRRRRAARRGLHRYRNGRRMR